MGDKCKKQVKVDNWGMFFLQRLQQHFAKNEFCNITLHFCNDQEIKAHRLVLDVCTEYFQLLEKQGLVVGNVVNMPEDMQPDVVIPVVNFMYTGRLEFHADLQERLYATAQQMKMTVLTKLLDAQTLNTQQQQARPPGKAAAPRNTPLKRMSPPGSFTNLQGKRISPRPVDPNLPQMLPGRKLPIWTRRSIPHHSHTGSSHPTLDRPIRIITTTVDETPRPTRFEWPEGNDDDSSPCPLATTFEDISYESKPLTQLKTAGTSVKPKITALVRAQPLQASFEDVLRTGAVAKRPAPPGQGEGEGEVKRLKSLDLQDVKDYVQEAQVRRHMVKAESDEEEEEDVDNDLATADTEEEDEREDVRTPHKSILKTQGGSHEEEPAPAKKVRFSLEAEEKENSAAPKVETRTAVPTRAAANVSAGSTPHVTNHAKIITEVLKKYPHLVKNNKNIRLKIMQRGGVGQPQVAVERDAVSGRPVKSKVSYVVLKSDVSGQRGKSALGGKLSDPQKPPTGAENVTGPWLCHGCGGGDPPTPLRLPTYYEYRRHLQDTHNEKIDARICEHCGHRASKRNLLLYHMYTKHGIPPPRNCQFPRCDQCDYVALSESLLVKHRNNHSNSRDYACKVCPAVFKSSGALQGHMQTNLHSDPYKKLFKCPFCQKTFMRNINLKAHVRSSHKDMVPRMGDGEGEEEEEGEGEEYEEGDEGEGQVMEVPVMEMSSEGQVGMTILAEHPDRSSEAEGFGHVASGIAASLGLEQTVILLDENQEYVIQTTEIVGGGYEDISEMQEYIVPEMINQDPPSAADPEQGLVAYVEEEQEVGAEQGLVAYVEGTEQHLHGGTEEVLMILTDHCYAEEVVSKDDHVVQNGDPQITEDQSNAAEMDNTSVCSVAESQAVQEMDSDSVTVQSDVKGSFAKPAVEMSDLLGEWDEELSQETEDGVDESAVAGRQEALPTRGDIPAEMYSVRQVAAEAPEAQLAVVVDAEEMAHDSASLMAETGENNALVMDVDSTFLQASQDTFTLHTEQNAQFAVETSNDTQFAADASQTTTLTEGNEHVESFPVGETDQNEQIAVESGHSAEFAAENNQLTIFTAETEEPPTFLPFSETKQTFVPFANSVRTPTLDGEGDEPGAQFVPEADPVTSLSSATLETDSLSIDADSRQGHLPFVGEAEGDLSFTEVPEQSEVKADDMAGSTCVALENAVAEEVDKEQASLNAELL